MVVWDFGPINSIIYPLKIDGWKLGSMKFPLIINGPFFGGHVNFFGGVIDFLLVCPIGIHKTCYLVVHS